MADATQVLTAFRDMSSVKNLTPTEMHDLIRDGLMAALARRFGPNVEAEIQIDETSGDIKITVLKEVVAEVEDPSREISLEEARWDDPEFEPGDILEIPVSFEEFGRNAVMAAKQRIVQRLREGERQRIRDEYADKVGELLSGEVQQVERGRLVVMLNKTREADALIPWKEQNPRERFRQGEAIRAVLKVVDETPKGPRLILSRADPLFVAALFKLEVPEIYQGIVEIKGIAREVGGRTKLAVASRDDSVDPVGACVGLKGSRVQAVVNELHGERIDIVPWHPDPEIYARRALAPANVAKVISDPERRVITAIVDEDQLSLAIGRNGQNVRLASQLIGWQIDLYGSREWLERGAEEALFGGGEQEYDVVDFPLGELDLAPAVVAALEEAGYSTFLDIIDLDRDDLLGVEGIGEEEADQVMAVIDELTVEEPAETDPEAEAEAAEMAEAREIAAEILGLDVAGEDESGTAEAETATEPGSTGETAGESIEPEGVAGEATAAGADAVEDRIAPEAGEAAEGEADEADEADEAAADAETEAKARETDADADVGAGGEEGSEAGTEDADAPSVTELGPDDGAEERTA